MLYQIRIPPETIKTDLDGLPKSVWKEVQKAIDVLRTSPKNPPNPPYRYDKIDPDYHRLTLDNGYKVVYTVDDTMMIVTIWTVRSG